MKEKPEFLMTQDYLKVIAGGSTGDKNDCWKTATAPELMLWFEALCLPRGNTKLEPARTGVPWFLRQVSIKAVFAAFICLNRCEEKI